MTALGQHIRARRLSMGLTLIALAERVGCTKGYLSAIETGLRERPPSARLLSRIESSLGVEAGSLVKRAAFDSMPAAARSAARELERQGRDARRLAQLVAGGLGGCEAEAAEARRLARGLVAGDGGVSTSVPVLDRDGMTTGHVSVAMELPAEAVGVEIVDDAMGPLYRRGDVVVVNPLLTPEPPCDCLVRLRGGTGAVFRRVFEDGELIRLQPLNLTFAPQGCGRGTFLSVAPVVCHIRRSVGSEGACWG